MRTRRALVGLCLVASLVRCGAAEELELVPESVEPSSAPMRTLPTTVSSPERLVAVGDVHGDLAALRTVLRLAELIDSSDRWTGGATVLVQVGDQLDRGDDEEAILELLDRLGTDAAAHGGAVYVLLGNHEIMNVQGDFRYVTEGGWRDFADTPSDASDPSMARLPASHRGRVAAFRPGGEWARRLASHNLVMVVGDTAFAHGGILPEHVRYGLENLNRETRAWLLGDAELPEILEGPDSPHWSRHYSAEPDAMDCALLSEVLSELSVERMVVAHTPQMDGISAACDERVFRVDVGLARHYGGRPQALEITSEGARVLGMERE